MCNNSKKKIEKKERRNLTPKKGVNIIMHGQKAYRIVSLV